MNGYFQHQTPGRGLSQKVYTTFRTAMRNPYPRASQPEHFFQLQILFLEQTADWGGVEQLFPIPQSPIAFLLCCTVAKNTQHELKGEYLVVQGVIPVHRLGNGE